LLSYFPSGQLADTTHYELEADQPDTIGGDTISNALFFKELKPFLSDIDYLADSSSATVIGKRRVPLNAQYDACIVDIRQSWFKHLSLLVYDKRGHRFTQRVTLAEWYGGESGQILTGSWVFDYNGDGQKDLVQRVIEHSSVSNADNDEVTETFNESAELLLWQKDKFVTTPTKDSSALVKRFPIRSAW
jgi:hypothetical protein